MPDWLSVILLGLVEGITEFLPISSTGHLLIVEKWLPVCRSWDELYTELFTVVIQSGAVIAVIPLFWKRFRGMLFEFKQPSNRDLLIKLSVAVIITCVVGMLFKKMGLELPDHLAPIAWSTLIGGVVIFAVEGYCKRWTMSDTVSWPIVIGFAVGQIIAMCLPGASRSGATIMIAMAMGLARPAATEFSFLLGVPTLLAAGGYEMLKAAKCGVFATLNWSHVALGFVASAISAFIVVKWLIRFVQGHTFNGFAVYRVLLGIAILVGLAKYTSHT